MATLMNLYDKVHRLLKNGVMGYVKIPASFPGMISGMYHEHWHMTCRRRLYVEPTMPKQEVQEIAQLAMAKWKVREPDGSIRTWGDGPNEQLEYVIQEIAAQVFGSFAKDWPENPLTSEEAFNAHRFNGVFPGEFYRALVMDNNAKLFSEFVTAIRYRSIHSEYYTPPSLAAYDVFKWFTRHEVHLDSRIWFEVSKIWTIYGKLLTPWEYRKAIHFLKNGYPHPSIVSTMARKMSAIQKWSFGYIPTDSMQELLRLDWSVIKRMTSAEYCPWKFQAVLANSNASMELGHYMDTFGIDPENIPLLTKTNGEKSTALLQFFYASEPKISNSGKELIRKFGISSLYVLGCQDIKSFLSALGLQNESLYDERALNKIFAQVVKLEIEDYKVRRMAINAIGEDVLSLKYPNWTAIKESKLVDLWRLSPKRIEWLSNKWTDKSLFKERTVFGPAGAERQFRFVDIIDEIHDDDVTTVKTSPEVVFENAARRREEEIKLRMKELVQFEKAPFKIELPLVQIMNSHDLIVEGETMDHCVGGYWHACKRGTTVICKGTANSVRFTVEISNQNGDWGIYQVKGHRNGHPGDEAIQFVQNWANKIKITYHKW